MIRARLFNVKYSPNLGDGLLSESLENALVECGCDSQSTYSVDLAARQGYDKRPTSGRTRLLKTANALPGFARQMLARRILAYKSAKVWLPHYKDAFQDCQVVVIGGGNLLTDLDLNFPTKLSAVVNEATRRGLPIAIYGVGVSDHWSATGLRIMRTALVPANVIYVSVRDDASKRSFDRLFGACTDCTAQVVCDPGILVSRYVGRPRAPAQEPKSVGLGIISAIALRYHSSINVSDRRLLAWYGDIYRSIQAQGIPVHLFTNGSPEDVAFARRVEDELKEHDRKRSHLTAANPTRLAETIAGFSAVIAFRMHALIAAYSYDRPIIALEWDPKVRSFMQAVGLGKRSFSFDAASPERVVDLVKRSMSAGTISGSSLVKEQALSDVAAMVRTMRASGVS